MTKLIRIENADMAQYKVKISVFDRNTTGGPDFLVSEHNLDHPCTMKDIHIHSSRYLIIEEYKTE